MRSGKCEPPAWEQVASCAVRNKKMLVDKCYDGVLF